MVNIQIDGNPVKAREGAMLIEAADQVGIPIPRFCYHKKLSIAANCRMCLVEVEKAPKPLPACATPVTEGMKVWTRSPKAVAAQKGTMEFLLINHPLDCPICDQGGECELQDVAMGYGKDVSRFQENKRVVPDKDIGPLVATDMTRCIHCTRCVRFGEEIAGVRELGATGRGEHTEIGTYVRHAMTSELSGNVIDLCPVGALTSKPFRFTARAWEMNERPAIAAHDAVGSNLSVHVRGRRVMRVVPRENEEVNEIWISDRDRFSYEGLNAPDRLLRPMVRDESGWRETDWEAALQLAAKALKDVAAHLGGDQIGGIASPSATLEELFLFQKLVRGLGSPHVDSRLLQSDYRGSDGVPWFGASLAEVEGAGAVLLVGSNLRKEQPLLAHRVRKAWLKGARIAAINPLDFDFSFGVEARVIAGPAGQVAALGAVCRVLLEGAGAKAPAEAAGWLEGVEVQEVHRHIARELREHGGKAIIFVGQLAQLHPDYAAVRGLAGLIASQCGAVLGILPQGANGTGAALAGALPYRLPEGSASRGLGVAAQFEQARRAYLLFGVEPDRDLPHGPAVDAALSGADCVVALSAYRNPSLERHAHVLLPVSTWAETSGTFVNGEGRWQSFAGVVPPPGDARPGWKVLRVLGNLVGLQGFDYVASDDVRDEVRHFAPPVLPACMAAWQQPAATEGHPPGLARISDVPPYAIDPVVRRAPALQRTPDGRKAAVHVNARQAGRLGLNGQEQVRVEQGGAGVSLALLIDERVPDGCAWIPAGLAETTELGPAHGWVRLAAE